MRKRGYFFRKALLPLTKEHIGRVPAERGVYVIYDASSGSPVYVGHSRVNIRRRLLSHVAGNGNHSITQKLRRGHRFCFEYELVLTR